MTIYYMPFNILWMGMLLIRIHIFPLLLQELISMVRPLFCNYTDSNGFISAISEFLPVISPIFPSHFFNNEIYYCHLEFLHELKYFHFTAILHPLTLFCSPIHILSSLNTAGQLHHHCFPWAYLQQHTTSLVSPQIHGKIAIIF